jgi:hypothetical protein
VTAIGEGTHGTVPRAEGAATLPTSFFASGKGGRGKRRERGGGEEKCLEAKADAAYIFVSPDSDKKPEKLKRSIREGAEGK